MNRQAVHLIGVEVQKHVLQELSATVPIVSGFGWLRKVRWMWGLVILDWPVSHQPVALSRYAAMIAILLVARLPRRARIDPADDPMKFWPRSEHVHPSLAIQLHAVGLPQRMAEPCFLCLGPIHLELPLINIVKGTAATSQRPYSQDGRNFRYDQLG